MDLKPLLNKLNEIQDLRTEAYGEMEEAKDQANSACTRADDAQTCAYDAEEHASSASSYVDDARSTLNSMEDKINTLYGIIQKLNGEEYIDEVASEAPTKLELPDTSTVVLNKDGTTSNN